MNSQTSLKASSLGADVITLRPPQASRAIAFELRGITKTFGRGAQEVRTLSPIDLQVHEGEFVVIVGPSGCGKSTLLKLVAGFDEVSTGEIRFPDGNGQDPRSGIGFVFQSALLVPWRNVRRNILMQLEMRGQSVSEGNAHCDELLDIAGLSDFADKYPWQLSGGMQQRVAICRALIHHPKLLLMDEPFGALDAMTRERMNLALQAIWIRSRKTVVLVTHSIPEAVFLADRIVVMSARPGCIETIYEVDLPRPRALSAMSSVRFGELSQQVRSHFMTEGAVD